MQLIFASTNIDKIREVKKLLPNHEVLSLLDFPEIEDVEETGTTLAEKRKSQINHYCKTAQLSISCHCR